MKYPYSKQPQAKISWTVFWSVFLMVVLFLFGFLWQDKVGLWGSRLLSLGAETTSTTSTVADKSPATDIELDLLRYENKQLRQLLGADTGAVTDHFVLARVLVRPPKTPYDTMIIDVGRDNLLQSGQLVYADYRTAVGEVAQVYQNQAVVLLFSTAGVKTEGELMIDNKVIPVELIGKGGNSFEIILPAKMQVEVGDYVFFPTDHTTILAIVRQVEPDEAETVNHIQTGPPTNVFSLPWLLIKK